VRWFLGYNLDEPLPEHSSLSRIRARYGLEIFRRFFDAILVQCQQVGLVWGKELYFDSTEVQANAAYSSLTPRFAVEAREHARERREAEEVLQAKEAVEAHLEALFADADAPHSQEVQPTFGESGDLAVAPAPATAAVATRSAWTGCARMSPPRRTGRPCASAKSGWNRSLPRRRTGTAYAASAYGASGE
jgi:hypothetical protein